MSKLKYIPYKVKNIYLFNLEAKETGYIEIVAQNKADALRQLKEVEATGGLTTYAKNKIVWSDNREIKHCGRFSLNQIYY